MFIWWLRGLSCSLMVPFTILLLGLTACTSLPRKPVPIANIEKAELVGMPGVRAWGGRSESRLASGYRSIYFAGK